MGSLGRWAESKKSPTGPKRTPKPEYLVALVTYLGSVGKVPFNFWWAELHFWMASYCILLWPMLKYIAFRKAQLTPYRSGSVRKSVITVCGHNPTTFSGWTAQTTFSSNLEKNWWCLQKSFSSGISKSQKKIPSSYLPVVPLPEN